MSFPLRVTSTTIKALRSASFTPAIGGVRPSAAALDWCSGRCVRGCGRCLNAADVRCFSSNSILKNNSDINNINQLKITPQILSQLLPRILPFPRPRKMSQVKIQKKAPFFEADALAADGTFTHLSLDDFKGKYVVLFFYPADFTFVCPTEIIAFSNRIEEFKKLNVEVIAASVDNKFSHLAWTNVPVNKGGLGKLNIPILADITKKISKDYGVLVEDGPDAGLALRGTFIIDPEQNLRVAQVNDTPIGRSVDEIVRLVEAIQFHAEHGEVCPVNWKKGDKGIKV